jgi:hypothetical protein
MSWISTLAPVILFFLSSAVSPVEFTFSGFGFFSGFSFFSSGFRLGIAV